MLLEMGILKNVAIFTGKHLCWDLFLIKLQDCRAATLLKRDSNTIDFLRILQNSYEHLFYRTSLVAASEIINVAESIITNSSFKLSITR